MCLRVNPSPNQPPPSNIENMAPKASVYGGPQKTNVSTITMSSDVPALKTGPRSEKAKAAIATNALSHGLRSTLTILPTESPEAYQALSEQLYADLAPVGVLETALVDRILGHLWRAKRIDRAEIALITLAMNPRTEEFRLCAVSYTHLTLPTSDLV